MKILALNEIYLCVWEQLISVGRPSFIEVTAVLGIFHLFSRV